MFIHNKKKKFVLSIINILIELVCLPAKLFSTKNNLQDIVPKKILLIRLDHVGDVVMTSPSFSLLRERFPDSEILLLTNNAGRELFRDDHRINKLLVFNWPWGQQKVKERFSLSRIKELIHLIRQLRSEKVDVFIDFRGDIRFIILFGVLTRAKVKISNSRSGKSILLDHISDYDVSRHEVERSLDVIECFVSSTDQPRPKIHLKDAEISEIKQFIKTETQQSPIKIAVVAPYSSRDVKSWPQNYFQTVISYLRSKDFTVIVVGTKDDKENALNMISEFQDHVFSFAGKTSVRELAALLSVSAIVVGVDTGVLHLASCFDIPIVAIFGSTRAIEFRPYSPYVVTVESNTCECNQFLHLKCDHEMNGYAKCLFQLEPQSVIRAIDSVV